MNPVIDAHLEAINIARAAAAAAAAAIHGTVSIPNVVTKLLHVATFAVIHSWITDSDKSEILSNLSLELLKSLV